MKIGQHALLLKMWNKGTHLSVDSTSSRMSLSPCPSTSSTSSLLTQQFSPPESLRDSIKELATLYKKKNSAEARPVLRKGVDPRKLTVILGGMIYNPRVGKGVKCQSIPKPNPQKVELPKKATFDIIVDKAKELYFGEDANASKMDLADSSGIIVQVDKLQWNLESYYNDNGYKPSRHKLYIMYDNEGDTTEADIFGDENDGSPEPQTLKRKYNERVKGDKIYEQGYTLPKLSTCQCGSTFRTYIPGKDCLLPDGSIECHQEPQMLCPACDAGYGLHMNQDLFPQLLELYPHDATN